MLAATAVVWQRHELRAPEDPLAEVVADLPPPDPALELVKGLPASAPLAALLSELQAHSNQAGAVVVGTETAERPAGERTLPRVEWSTTLRGRYAAVRAVVAAMDSTASGPLVLYKLQIRRVGSGDEVEARASWWLPLAPR